MRGPISPFITGSSGCQHSTHTLSGTCQAAHPSFVQVQPLVAQNPCSHWAVLTAAVSSIQPQCNPMGTSRTSFFFPLTHVGASQIVQQLSRPTLTFCFFRINICLPPDHFLGTQFPLASWLLPSDHMPICHLLWRGLSIENRVRPHIPPNRPHFW